MQYRTLGNTREPVSALGLGGFHIGKIESEKESIRIIHAAINSGITFMDNSWDYNEGRSEVRMGKALKNGYRAKVFLMTKIDARTAGAARMQIEESLKRLQTDCVDLLQFHEVIRIRDPERIFDEGEGALSAVLEAKKAGKLRYIGFTGHKASFFGDLHTMGTDGVRFFTEQKSVTAHWFSATEAREGKVRNSWDGMI